MKKLNFHRLNLVILSLLVGWLLFPAVSQAQSTMAYWRFENPTDSNYVPKGDMDPGYTYYPSVPDLSGNGNVLSVWEEGDEVGAGFEYTNDLPASIIPLTGATNLFSIRNAGGGPSMTTWSSESYPVEANDVETWSPTSFTIEMSFKPESGGYRTYVGRDGEGVANIDGALAPVYFQLYPDDTIAFKFADIEGNWHVTESGPGYVDSFIYDEDPNGETGHWYNAVAVCDGGSLRLYVDDAEDDYGWELVDETELNPTYQGSTAMATASDTSASDWHGGAWTVGRGMHGGGHVDRGYGFIDEVRLTDGALEPNQWLFSPSLIVTGSPENQVVDEGSDATFEVTVDSDNTLNYQWYKSADPEATPAEDTEISGATSAVYTLSNASLSDEAYYYCLISDTSTGDSVYSRPAGLAIARRMAHWTLGENLYHSTTQEYVEATNNGFNIVETSGEPNFVTGIFDDSNGAALIEEGSGYGSVEGFNPAQYSGEFTVSFWLNWDGPDGGFDTLLAQRLGEEWNSQDTPWIVDIPTDTATLELKNPSFNINAENVITDNGEWQQIVATTDGNVGQIYVDGSLAAEGTFMFVNTSDAPLAFGARTIGDEVTNGAIDELKIYNYKMTDLQVAEEYFDTIGEKACVESERPENDYTGDCVVNFADFAQLAEWWMYSGFYEAE